MKQRIFIGSSFEAKDLAQKLHDGLSSFAEVVLWTNAFDFGKSNYENLVSQIAFFDYAILIATADDETISRGNKAVSPRDNVVLEFGLFAGGLGRNRVFYIVEKKSKLPTDLLGISLPQIPKKKGTTMNKALNDCIEKVKNHIINKEKTFDLGFLPSSALAYGYFTNFVEKTVQRLLEDKQSKKIFELQSGKKFQIKNIRFTILIPEDLSDDMFSKVRAKRLKSGWEKLKLDPKDVRDYDFSVDISKIDKNILHLVDIPLTLNALGKSIEIYLQKTHIGKDEKEQILERREILNFEKTLNYLISKNSITKGIVTIKIVKI